MRYANGEFNYENGSLIFSCSKIEISMHRDEIAEGSFEIEEQSGRAVVGDIYSSNLRMKCNLEHFSGEQIQVSYRVDARNLIHGDVIKGYLSIVSDVGEYMIPFVVMVLHESIESSLGTIKNLFHFANLAKSNWDEAVKVFYSENFIDILNGNDIKYKNLYRGLIKQGNKNCNLEEFLISINKKQKIEYLLEHENIKIDNPQEKVSQTVKINRNGWGYTWLIAKSDGEFLTIEKNRLSDNDFLGNCCHFTFYVNSDKLHEGKNIGRIIFKHIYGKFEVVIHVNKNTYGKRSLIGHKQKSLVYSLTRHYLDFSMKKINMSKWLLLTDELLLHRKNIDEYNVENSLFEAHLLITQERYNEAKWILDHKVSDGISDSRNALYCYYLYLTSLYNVDEFYTKQITEQVNAIYEQDHDDWRVAWLILSMSEELNKNRTRKWNFAINQVALGCQSPIFYLEVIKLLNATPSLLVKITDAEKKVLYFGAKQEILSNELMLQITYLALRQKIFDNQLYKILKLIYCKNNSDEALQAICVLLMKGGKIGTEYFKWYDLAVSKNFAITKLYECYMMSMNLMDEVVIPKRVLMYFSYQSELPVAQNAYLYAYVIKNSEKYPDIIASFKGQIDRFVIKQLYAGKIDRNLALLYQEVIMKDMFTPDNAKQLAKLLFVHCIYIKDSGITKVVVMDERMKEEKTYPVINGLSYVALPGNEYTLFLEDAFENRFYGTKDYSTERYFLPRKFLPQIEEYADDDLLFDLYISEENKDLIIITPQNVNRYEFLEQSDKIDCEFQNAVRMCLIRYWFEKDEETKLDSMLERTQENQVPLGDRNELIRYMIIRGFYKKAFSLVLCFGAENIEPKILVRVASSLIEHEGCIESQEMTYIIYSAFERGKYNEVVLGYLARFYKGLAKNLRNIWKAANNFYIDTYDICERMIIQTLDTGAFLGEEIPILKQYVEGGAKTEIEVEYLSYCGYEYLVRERVVDEYIFSEMQRIYVNEGELPLVCMLAFLKYHSNDMVSLSDETKNAIQEFIRILYVKKNIIMPYFLNYRSLSIESAHLGNLSFIEYKGNPDSKVMIHYAINHDVKEQNGYSREEMVNMYAGIYVKTFLLFFGESVQYYITEEYANKEQLTESGKISKNDSVSEPFEDRYSAVNDIAIADTLKDYDTAFHLLEEYEFKKYLITNVFTLQ